MKTFLQFITENRNKAINEAFNVNDFNSVLEKIENILKKHTGDIHLIPGYLTTVVDSESMYSIAFLTTTKKLVLFNFLRSETSFHVYSISFIKDGVSWLFNPTGKGKADLTIYTLGSSVVYFLPIVWTVLNNNKFNISNKEAIELGRSVYKTNESYNYYVGAQKYVVYENLTNEVIRDTYNIYTEAIEDPDLKQFKKNKIAQKNAAYPLRKDSPEAAENFKKLYAEYTEINNAIAGGASNLTELKLAVKHNVSLVAEIDSILKKQEDELKAAKASKDDPEVAFQKMSKYVKMVINGINNSIILCGAPGVGKTYNVKRQLKAAGYNEGHNLFTIKGKCTPRRLYLALYEYQKKGDIVLIDDADALVGPNAPEDSINILKAALDSTSDDEGRLVSYGVSGKLMDDEGMEIPKRFYYNGGVIVITNHNAGNLDTALRGRSFIQDIHFDTEDVLQIIKKLMPAIDPEHLSAEAKFKAYEYLQELYEKGSSMEISIRTFGICAKIFETSLKDPDFSEEIARSMIGEQMALQSARGGKKY